LPIFAIFYQFLQIFTNFYPFSPISVKKLAHLVRKLGETCAFDAKNLEKLAHLVRNFYIFETTAKAT
jgi:hypothetical protein